MKSNILKILFPILAIGLLTLLWACKGKPAENDEGKMILKIGNGAEPEDLDPHAVTGITEFNVIKALLEGLVTNDPKTLEPQPGAAEKWTISDDNLVYTFHLRENAHWSNGDKVKADDFMFTYERMLTPDVASQYAYMLYPVKNAKKFHEGNIKDFSLVGFKAKDPSTLEITLESPTPYFLSLLAHHSWYPLHPPTIVKFGGKTKAGTKWTQPGNYVGNGPFQLKEWVSNKIIKVERNPHYWDASIVQLDEIHFYSIENISTEERTFRNGQIHITGTLPVNKIDPYKKENPEALRIEPYLGIYYYAFNTEKPPLDDTRIRRALCISIDRKSIVENVTQGGQIPAFHLAPINTAGYISDSKFEENLEEAKTLLAEAGYPNGEGLPTIELLYNSSENHKKIAEAIQQMWKKNLNVNISLVNQEWKVYLASRRNGDFQIARAGWIGDYNDPNTFLDMMTSYSGNNHTGWSSPEYDEYIHQAANAKSREERYAHFQKASKMLVDEIPVLPIYFYTSVYLVNPIVQGWHPNILDDHPYKYVSISQ